MDVQGIDVNHALTPTPMCGQIGGSPPREALLQTVTVTCLVVTVGSFFAVQPLIDLAKHAANALPWV